ncbi:MAG: DNA polymerase-3 subunit delta [Cryomorphaceae bacterium]|jgi:DNA polymerase-3 subunit delta
MRVSIDDLAASLNSNSAALPKILLINGNEPLLIEEALDQARQVLKQCGFDERIKYQMEVGFDWGKITGVGQVMSLFSERRLIELRVPNKLGIPGTKAITEYAANPAVDDLLVIVMPYLDKKQRSAKWLKAVETIGWVVDCYEISPQQFPAWLKKRLQSRSLRVEPGVVDMLNEQLEGNVLAAAQEIDKLQVLASDGAVTLKLLSESLADQARFDVYSLTEVCLLGDFDRALRIKNRLQSEGTEPVIVVWALVREIRLIAALSAGLQSGQNKSMLFKQNRIWSKREPAVNAALQRISTDIWYSLLEDAAHLDQTVKGQRYSEVGPAWHQIERLCARLCGAHIIQQAS